MYNTALKLQISHTLKLLKSVTPRREAPQTPTDMRFSDLRLLRKTMLIAVIPFIAGVAFMSVLWLVVDNLESNLAQEREARDAVELSLLTLTDIAQAGVSVEVYGKTLAPNDLARFRALCAEIREHLVELRNNQVKDQKLQSITNQLISQSEQALKLGEDTVKMEELGGSNISRLQMLAMSLDAVNLVGQMRNSARQARELQSRLHASMDLSQSHQSRRLLRIVLLIGLLGAGLTSALVALIISREIVSRINRLVENSRRLAKFEPLLAVSPGSDEISNLDRSFHEMASRLLEATELLRASEARVRLLMERMPASLLLITQEGEVKYVNHAATLLLNRPAPELTERNLLELFRNPAGSDASLQALLAQRQGTSPLPLDTAPEFGETRRVEMTVDAVEEEADSYVAIGLDISERHKWNQLRDRLTSMFAHDIAAPLTMINGMLLTLTSEENVQRFSQSDKETILALRTQTQRLMRMFDDLLRLGTSIVDEMPLKRSHVSLKTILRECVSAVSVTADEKDIDLVLESNDFSVFVDTDRFTRVVINLLTNAVKFSPAAGTVRIVASENKEEFELQVIDQGPGIPEHMEQAIFEPYRQAAPNAAIKVGSGLGLAICAKIVSMHGGTIGAFNNPTHGATFWIRLPKLDATEN